VGELVGETVGTFVEVVGAAVVVGDAVRELEGDDVGEAVMKLGRLDGDTVGESVEVAVGESMGVPVGEAVGDTLGRTDGNTDGSSVA